VLKGAAIFDKIVQEEERRVQKNYEPESQGRFHFLKRLAAMIPMGSIDTPIWT